MTNEQSLLLENYLVDENGKFVLTSKQVSNIVFEAFYKKNSTVSFEICINGKSTVVIQYNEIVDLSLFSPATRRKIVKNFVIQSFKNCHVTTTDGKMVGIKSTGGADKILFQSKQEIAFFITDLVQTGIPSGSRDDYSNKNVKWFYYDSYIAFGSTIFYGKINIKEAGGLFSFYDINKIKEVETETPSNGEHSSYLINNIPKKE